MEIWKDVKGYEGLYQVSSLGNVRSMSRYIKTSNCENRFSRGKNLAMPKTHRYARVVLCKGNVKKTNLVHRLVFTAFVSDIPKGYEINHIDGVKTNNNVDNLELSTRSQNMLHSFQKRINKNMGETHSKAKMTRKQVLQLRTEYSKSNKSIRSFCNDQCVRYGVTNRALEHIIKRKNWKHI